MKPAPLIAVVGPSGVGKDSILAGLKASAPHFRLVRRVITRPEEMGGEAYTSVTVPVFEAMQARGDFCIHWGAHGLFYGIPQDVVSDTDRGIACLANLSRGALVEAAERFNRLIVLHITASPDVLANRLSQRGREDAADIAARLARAHKPLPPGLNVMTLCNDGPLDTTIAQALRVLQPVRA